MQKRSLCLAVALCLAAAAANALPTGPVVSGNGQLEFSNFQFFSPSGSVDEDEIAVGVLADGIVLSGPVSASDELRSFFVTYEVRALGPGIVEASLQLDSDIESGAFGLVLSTKRILGDPHQGSGWHKQDPWKDKDPWRDEHRRGRGGWKRERDDFHDDHHEFELGDRRTLAFLKTAEWQTGRSRHCDHPSLGLGNDGAIRLVEAGFAVQDSLRVVEHVLVSGRHGTATWNSSTNRFTVVPEPGAASLTLLGLCLLALRSRRSG